MNKSYKRLFVHRLEPNRPRCAELALLGDIHYGYPTVEYDKLREDIAGIVERKCKVILMGDLMECGLKTSVGDSIYRQELDPQQQMEEVYELLKPLSDKNLILGSYGGNHEMRIYKDTGIDVAKILAKKYFGVHYFGYSAYHLFRVGKFSYTAYITHGSTGSRLPYTKMRALIDYGRHIKTHIIASGHTHELNSYTATYKEISLKHKKVITKKMYYILTGAYLGYDNSYAEQKGLLPAKIGYARLKLYVDKWDIYVSI